MDYKTEYNKALEAIKELLDNNPSDEGIHNWVNDKFPWLLESEDEKIRKMIINHLMQERGSLSYDEAEEAIDWLEKQDKNIQVMCPTFTFDDILALQCCMETVKKVQEDKELYEQLQSLHNRLHDAYWLGKQDDQRPQGKSVIEAIKEENVEQKFQIIKNTWYICTCTTCSEDSRIWFKKGIVYLGNDILKYDLGFEPNDYQDYFRLWSIEDAKPGDILNANGALFIYKKHDKDYVYFYCGVNLGGEFIKANENDIWNSNNKIYPTTKEQRDTLMKAMTDLGWEFDFEKKELKKIRVIDEGKAEMDYCFTKMMNDEKVSSTWSVEDEFKVQRICQYLEEAKKYYGDITEIRNCIDWLKFIQNKISTQNIKSPLWKKVDQPIYINTKDIALVQKKDQSDSFKGYILYLDHTLDPKVDERYILLKDLL